MKEQLEVGLEGEWIIETTQAMAAAHIADEGFVVYSTPAMVGHMERACVEAVAPFLDDDEVSLGVRVEISHIAGTRIGETVRTAAKLVEVEGRRLTFTVEAHNEREMIGEGRHQRVVVKRDRLPRRE
ncbi:MAG: thioesterase family protein [Deltaproteobacteria bacterium]|nr:thioesterase family protein [Deltaproteobacteria bacterium]